GVVGRATVRHSWSLSRWHWGARSNSRCYRFSLLGSLLVHSVALGECDLCLVERSLRVSGFRSPLSRGPKRFQHACAEPVMTNEWTGYCDPSRTLGLGT